jgi:hypothetical protein
VEKAASVLSQVGFFVASMRLSECGASETEERDFFAAASGVFSVEWSDHVLFSSNADSGLATFIGRDTYSNWADKHELFLRMLAELVLELATVACWRRVACGLACGFGNIWLAESERGYFTKATQTESLGLVIGDVQADVVMYGDALFSRFSKLYTYAHDPLFLEANVQLHNICVIARKEWNEAKARYRCAAASAERRCAMGGPVVPAISRLPREIFEMVDGHVVRNQPRPVYKMIWQGVW